MQSLEDLKRHWAETGSGLRIAPTPEEKIVSLESYYRIGLPADFRTYLSCCTPENGEHCDQDFTYWWAIDQMKSLADECGTSRDNPRVAAEPHVYIVFADYMLWCWAWAINCGTSDDRRRIAVIGYDNDAFVADSFAEFVSLYVHEPSEVRVYR